MLIIFDLDDTLIDTSGCITHYKLEDALNLLVNQGLQIPDFNGSLDLLRRLNSTSESARHALSEFIEILGAEKKFYEMGVKEIYENVSPDLSVYPLEGALELLSHLAEHHQLALVTVGNPSQQMNKLEKAGIDSGIFSKIAVCEDRNKKPHYQMIMDELGYLPTEVIVCGDRVVLDLMPARELGLKTVQMRWGRGLNAIGFKGEVDYCISELKELKGIVSDIMTFSSF